MPSTVDSLVVTENAVSFAAETSPDHIGPAPRRILSDREKRAEAETAAAKKVRR